MQLKHIIRHQVSVCLSDTIKRWVFTKLLHVFYRFSLHVNRINLKHPSPSSPHPPHYAYLLLFQATVLNIPTQSILANRQEKSYR